MNMVEKIAENMHVRLNAFADTGGTPASFLDGQVSRSVSMADANSFTIDIPNVLWLGMTATTNIEIHFQQSNDQSNWFTKAVLTLVRTGPTPPQTNFPLSHQETGYGMAYVRLLFLVVGTTTPGDGGVLDCTLSTALI